MSASGNILGTGINERDEKKKKKKSIKKVRNEQGRAKNTNK
jgi:hypothetical protein